MGRKVINLTGQKFGRLTIIKRAPNNKQGSAMWFCRCECEKEIIVQGGALRRGATQSCGCFRATENLIGQKFGYLAVIERAPDNKQSMARWLCECKCGNKTIVLGNNLKKGTTRSCGCFQRESIIERTRLSYGYACIQETIRCYKNSAKKRGLEYNLIEKHFIEITQQDCYYCGAKPNNIKKSGHHNGDYVYNGIDRIDNNKGYTIDNIVPCCAKCNYAKGKLTLQEFKELIEGIYNHMFKNKRGKAK